MSPVAAPIHDISTPDDEQHLWQARQQVAEVLAKVYWEVWTPLQGLARWPYPAGLDASIDVAFQALAYLEADEDYHATDTYWLDAQLQWLNTLIEHLKTGQPLPAAVLATYSSAMVTSPYWEQVTMLRPVIMVVKKMVATWAAFSRAVAGLLPPR